jgi:hypothetical protein
MAAPVGVVNSASIWEGASGTPLSSFQGSGGGYRHPTVGTAYLTVSGRHRACRIAFGSQPTQAGSNSHNIRNAVQSPDFVEMHCFYGLPVHCRFGAGQTAKDTPGELADFFRQSALVQNALDIAEMPVMSNILFCNDAGVDGAETATLHSFELDSHRQLQLG